MEKPALTLVKKTSVRNISARKTSVGNKVPPFSLADYMADRLGMQPVGLTTGEVPTLSHMPHMAPHPLGGDMVCDMFEKVTTPPAVSEPVACLSGRKASQPVTLGIVYRQPRTRGRHLRS